MKILQKQCEDGAWFDVAIRNHQVTRRERRLLDAGQTVVKDGVKYRLGDYAKRLALIRLFR